MVNRQNSIVLNGKLYDALTGDLIHDHTRIAAAPPKHKIHKQHGLVMDGVVSHKQYKAPVHARRHKPERSATLMRSTVSKPAYRPVPKREEPANIHHKHIAERLARAKAVQKSHHIQRFPSHSEHVAHRSVAKKHANLPVRAAPTPHKANPPAHQAPPPAALKTLTPSEELVSNALKNARAHEANQPFAKKRRRRDHLSGWQRTSRLAAASLAVLVLVGFFVYQNIPNLSMRLAASRAGVEATLPGYSPAGFSQDKLVSFSPGKVTVSFHSNTDDRQYKLIQQVSNWNSQALADNFLTAHSKQFQTYQASGKTIYIFDGSNATWVNGGIWYQIEGPSSLNQDQILKIANSI